MANEQVAQIEGIDPPATDQLGSLTHDEYQEWNRTGKLPELQPETTAEPAEQGGASATPEPTERIESRKRSTRERFDELLNERKATKARIAELESQLEEARKAKVEMKPAPPAEPVATAPKEEAKPAAAGPYKPSAKAKAELDRINADLQAGKYATYEDYSDEKAAVIAEDRLEQREAARIAQKEAEEKASREQSAKERLQQTLTNWSESLKMARTVHADFDEVTRELTSKSVIPTGSVVEGWILESPHGTEIMYHLGSHREELKALLDAPTFEQARILTRLETKLQDGSKPAASASQEVPPKQEKQSRAPEPAKELGTGGGATRDAISEAVKSGDVAAYLREANARDVQRIKSQRG